MDEKQAPWVEIMVDTEGRLVGAKASGVNIFIRKTDLGSEAAAGEATEVGGDSVRTLAPL